MFLGFLLLLLPLAGCTGKESTAQGPQAVPVKLQQLNSGLLEDSREFLGNLQAVKQVQLVAQINGQITSIPVNYGQFVKVGTPILQLQPDQTATQLAEAISQSNAAQMALKTAEANLSASIAQRGTIVAQLNLNQVNYKRAKVLFDQGAVSALQLDEQTANLGVSKAQLEAQDETIQANRAAVKQAQANLKATQAQVGTAQVPFGFKQVTAPINGVVGNINVKVGDYVRSGESFTTITENAFFDLLIAVPTNYSKQLRQGVPVQLLDPNSNELLSQGSIFFVSPVVDNSAQSILTRARFPNSSGKLRNGQYVKARVIWSKQPGVLVPVTAVAPLSGQNFVFVAQNTPCKQGDPNPSGQIVCQRLVELGAVQGQSYQVLQGLKPGDNIAVSGIINLRNGVPIKPES